MTKPIFINGTSYSLVYKLVTKAGGQLFSCNASHSSMRLNYTKIGQWVDPILPKSKIFVFKDLDSVKAFRNCESLSDEEFINWLDGKGYVVLICVAKNVSTAKYRSSLSSAVKTISELWANVNTTQKQWTIYKNSHMVYDVPKGTVFAESVMPIARLDSNSKLEDYSLAYKKFAKVDGKHLSTNANILSVRGDYLLEYALGKWTTPKIPKSKLFVFNSMLSMRTFSAGWGSVCSLIVAKNKKRNRNTPRLDVYDLKYTNMFWKSISDKNKPLSIVSVRNCPTGTYFAEAVMPILISENQENMF